MAFRLSLPLLFGCLWPLMSAAQRSGEDFLQVGLQLYEAEQYLAAEPLFERALEQSRLEKDRLSEGHALVMLGECAFTRQDYSYTQALTLQAKELVDQYLNSDSTAYYFLILQNLGVTSSYLGRIDLQRSYYNQALLFAQRNFPDSTAMLADAVFNVGAAYYRSFALDSARYWFDSTLVLAQQVQYDQLISTTLLNQSVIHAAGNDFDQAILCQEKALQLTQSPAEQILGYTNIADYYRSLGDLPMALQYLDRSRALLKQAGMERQVYGAMVILNGCQVYYEMGDTSRYLQELNELLDWLPADNPDFTGERQKALNYLATLQVARRQWQAAEATCRQALATHDRSYQENDLGSYYSLAQALLGQQKFAASLEYLQKGIQVIAPTFRANTPFANPRINAIENEELAFSFLVFKLRLLTTWAQQQGAPPLFEEALATYRTVDELLTHNRQQLRSRLSRSALGLQIRPLTYWALELFYQLYERTGDDQWIEQAFACQERSRSLLITQKLMSRQAIQRMVPEELRQREQALASQADYYRLLLSRTANLATPPQTRQEWQDALFRINTQWEDLLDTLETNFPAFHQMKYQIPRIPIAEIPQQVIHPDEVLLSYLATDKELFVVGISADTNFFYRLPLQRSLEAQVDELRQSITSQSAAYYPLAYALYQQMLQPLEVHTAGRSLVIIPDGRLWHVPFGALLTSPPPDPIRPQAIHFLLRNTKLRLIFSAHAQLARLTEDPPPPYQHGVLSMAPLANQQLATPLGSLPPLPGSREEQAKIKAYQKGKGLHLFGRRASRSAFLQEAPRAQIIHIATHAVLDEQDPNLSRLYFYPGLHEQPDDNILHVYDLYNLQFRSELAVLSACQTGNGRLAGGEGITGLAQAFAFAGCPNLIVSAWPVNDRAGPPLMAQFYQQLGEGKGKASALNTAQRAYLDQADPLALHPYYWATFMAIGDDEPVLTPSHLEQHSAFPAKWLLLALGVLSILFYVIRRKTAA